MRVSPAGVVDACPKCREAQGVERPRELGGRASALSPAEVVGHRLERERDVALPQPRPARASASRPRRSRRRRAPQTCRSRVDALDQAELVGGVEADNTSSPPPGLARSRSARGPFGRGWSPRRPGRRTGRASAAGRRQRSAAGRRRGLSGGSTAGGRLARLGPRQAALDERPKRGVLRRGRLRRPIHRPTGVGTGWERDGQRRHETNAARSGRDPALKTVIARRRETRDRAPTLNPKVEGSNPSRPIADDPLESGDHSPSSVRPRLQPWPPPTRSAPSDHAPPSRGGHGDLEAFCRNDGSHTVSAPRSTSAPPAPNDTTRRIIRRCRVAHPSTASTVSSAAVGRTMQIASARIGRANQMAL